MPMIRIALKSNHRDMAWHDQIQRTFEALAIETGIDGMERILLPMAIVEAINNIIKHAYQLANGQPILLEAQHSHQTLCIELRDQGLPMPLPLPDGKMTDAAAESGRGWRIIRAVFPDVDYERINNENLLRLKRPLGEKIKHSNPDQTSTTPPQTTNH